MEAFVQQAGLGGGDQWGEIGRRKKQNGKGAKGRMIQDLTEKEADRRAAMQVLRGAISAHLIMSGYNTQRFV